VTGTLFMIHGMWGGPWMWDNFRRVFEGQGYRCVVPTLRYHDMDPDAVPDPRLGTTSLLDYAEDLGHEIRALGTKPVILGHSMGGLLAQMLGSRGLAHALILQTPAPPAGILALRPSVVKSFWSAQTKWGFWRKPFRQTFDEAVYSMLFLLPRQEQEQAYARFVYESGRAACEIGYWFLDPRRAAAVDASKVTCPVLVIGGELDRITPAAVVRKVAAKYAPRATYREFPGHSHWVMGEPGWEQIARFEAEWLRSVLDR